ncbi:hypothetical protein GCM10008098_04760 [Rhodanobacter panaciterrae]|uniref:Uncharacterized protein n=1 Tax=Rhodanobacter panaciterrae TaxID=490572 RepID=A0ABQ2ZKJ6_9GAMM|nr:hypothetical protein [Rhodanobacter panaciterrae]GGY16509.1 hypothetical protein GCM10008098_04760 [Rhodanobacter panaciterrae]
MITLHFEIYLAPDHHEQPVPVPHPSYTNAKPYIKPVLDLFSELGTQDACLQLQELAIVHLEKSAQAMSAQMNDYLKLLYISNDIPRGTYSFAGMREQIYKSFIALTHSIFDKTIKECNGVFQKNNTSVTWVTTLKGGAALHPLEQLCYNCSPAQRQSLTQPPEFRLLEYYRRIRIASAHINGDTAQDAEEAFHKLTTTDHLHFQQYVHILGAPNAPNLLTFQDFKLYTRAIKYYSNLVNDVCA